MVHIMYGLPASGKTTLAMKLFEENKDKKIRYDRQKVVYQNLDKQDFKKISNKTDYGIGNSDVQFLIIDGFFKSTKEIAKFWEYNGFLGLYLDKIIVHVFEPNKQACLANDNKRNRKEKASKSISEGIEQFDLEVFKKTFFKGREFYLRDVEFQIINEKVLDYSDKDDFTIYSPWLVGNDISDDFEELDSWLEENYPNLTFLQYKKICKFIMVEENFTCDYYEEQDTRSIQRSIKISDILGVLK